MTIFVALVVGIMFLAFTVWSVRFIAAGPPPEPSLDTVVSVDVPYLCTVCGLSLTVTEAQDGEIKAPKHCREEMVRAI